MSIPEVDPHATDAMLSYCWRDEAVVARVEAALQAAPFRTWFDKKKMGGGAQYKPMIEIAVQRCGVMLVFGSPHYEESISNGDGCAQEIALAVQRLRQGRPVLGVNVGPAGYSPHKCAGDYGAVFGGGGGNCGRLWVDLRSEESMAAGLAVVMEQVACAGLPYVHTPQHTVGGRAGSAPGGSHTSDLNFLAAASISPPLYEVDTVISACVCARRRGPAGSIR
jgi:hypothetical protein